MKITNLDGEILKAGCVVLDGSKILLVTNPDRSVWAYPKGHMEPGETVELTAVRETREETGYEVELTGRLDDLTYINAKSGQPIRVAMFNARPLRHTDGPVDEIWEWVELARARELVVDNLKPYLPQV